MDWKRMEDIFLQRDQCLELIDNIASIFTSFEDLYQKLKQCNSVTSCANLYPQIGTLLTAAATNPYLGYHKKLTRLVIDCILEYTKYDFNSTTTTTNTTDIINSAMNDQSLSKSTLWCLQRLKRVSYGSGSRDISSNTQSIDHQVQHIMSNIQHKLKNGPLTISKIKRLCDLSILLFNNQVIIQLLDSLVDSVLVLKKQHEQQRNEHLSVLKENNYSNHNTNSYYSEKFIYHLLKEVTDEQSDYHNQWPVELKTKIWDTIPDILEYEWMNWLDKHLDHLHHRPNHLLTSQHFNTSTTQGLRQRQHILLQGLKQRPCLIHTSFDIMTTLLLEKGLTDWRIISLWNKIITWCHQQLEIMDSRQRHPKEIFIQMGFTMDQVELLLSFIKALLVSDDDGQDHVHQLYKDLFTFIYGGTSQHIHRRRNEAWFISMMYPDYIKKCICLWIRWCTLEQEPWDDQIENISFFLSWLVNPSLDNRMDNRHHILKDWILLLKGYNKYHVKPTSSIGLQTFLNDWMVMLNGHIQIGVYILVTLIECSNHWTIEECITIIQTFIYGSTTIKVTIPSSHHQSYLLSILQEQISNLKDSRKDKLLTYINDHFFY
ncbi:hypothetical protein BJ944DRAFT_270947 [Cunninghamella echinulata]|nr:hypothetical protein BJ944DRAFT_270947 [Cunninghamella echinulata]